MSQFSPPYALPAGLEPIENTPGKGTYITPKEAMVVSGTDGFPHSVWVSGPVVHTNSESVGWNSTAYFALPANTDGLLRPAPDWLLSRIGGQMVSA